MKSSLIPEKPILVYPSLANTVGLDEAILLAVLADLTQGQLPAVRNGYAWYSLATQNLCNALPFWGVRDILRVNNSLRDKGVVLLGASIFGDDEAFRFAFNEKVVGAKPTEVVAEAKVKEQVNLVESASYNDTPFGKNFISSSWRPSEDTLAQLGQHNIPSHFAIQQVPEFVTYWRDRGEAHRSWETKFHQHVLFKWRKEEMRLHKKGSEILMDPNWRPSEDALEMLIQHKGVSLEFIEDAIPEFVFHWRDQIDMAKNWDNKFYRHICLQWEKYNSALENDAYPKPIAGNWQPSEDVYDVLRLANIDLSFAQELLPEYVLYWQDSKQLHTSWNTRFLQHVKRQWARRHSLTSANNQSSLTHSQRSTREITLEEKLTDRSWAQRSSPNV